MLNYIAIMGVQVKEIELHDYKTVTKIGCVGNGTIVAKDKDESHFIDYTAFDNTAKLIEGYIHKGDRFIIEGKLIQESWTNKTGEKRSKLKVLVSRVEIINTKAKTQENAENKAQNGNITEMEEKYYKNNKVDAKPAEEDTNSFPF